MVVAASEFAPARDGGDSYFDTGMIASDATATSPVPAADTDAPAPQTPEPQVKAKAAKKDPQPEVAQTAGIVPQDLSVEQQQLLAGSLATDNLRRKLLGGEQALLSTTALLFDEESGDFLPSQLTAKSAVKPGSLLHYQGFEQINPSAAAHVEPVASQAVFVRWDTVQSDNGKAAANSDADTLVHKVQEFSISIKS